MKKVSALAFAFLFAAACGGAESETPPAEPAASSVEQEGTNAPADDEGPISDDVLDSAGERFVKLALAIGQHDPNFVDAYNGPAEWAEEAKANQTPLADLEAEAETLFVMLDDISAERATIRSSMLRKQVIAARARMRMAGGTQYPFDEETRLLYDAVAPQYDVREFHAALAEIEGLLPGDAPLHQRVDDFRNSLAIPEDKLQVVFDAAIAECRRRTLGHYTLPEGETFSLEFVKDKPWGGYNWYQGKFESLIQVNTDFPIIIDRAVDLGCHEGYPGHHTWNVMLERDLLNKKGWIEYSVYPLFSPLSITAEGSANYGIELAFPGDEKIAFERDVLFPLAGLDPEKAQSLVRLNELRRKLSHSRNHIARLYLDGDIDKEEAIRMGQEFGLQSRERAEQGIDFIETYRGYVINYNIGRDLVTGYVARNSEETGDRWGAFETLLTTPLSASDIAADR